MSSNNLLQLIVVSAVEGMIYALILVAVTCTSLPSKVGSFVLLIVLIISVAFSSSLMMEEGIPFARYMLLMSLSGVAWGTSALVTDIVICALGANFARFIAESHACTHPDRFKFFLIMVGVYVVFSGGAYQLT